MISKEKIMTELESFAITFVTVFLLAVGDTLSTFSWNQLTKEALISIVVAGIRAGVKSVYNSFKSQNTDIGTPAAA